MRSASSNEEGEHLEETSVAYVNSFENVQARCVEILGRPVIKSLHLSAHTHTRELLVGFAHT